MGKNNRKFDPNAEYILYYDKKSGKHIRCNMWTPLMWKIKYKKHFTLTDADIRDINKVNSAGISALVLAVIHSDNLYSVAKIKMLIRAGASINTRYRCLNAEDKFNVLWFAVRSYNNNICEDSSDINSNLNIIKLLIKENADDNYDDGNYINPQSSLLCAFYDKLDESIINLLLNIKNLNVNTKTTKGNTVLHYAIDKQYSYDIINKLLKRGADINATNIHHVSILMVAIYNKSPLLIIKLLIENGAEINCISKNGKSPLSIAYTIDDYPAIKLLLQHGAKLSDEYLGGENIYTFYEYYFSYNKNILEKYQNKYIKYYYSPQKYFTTPAGIIAKNEFDDFTREYKLSANIIL